MACIGQLSPHISQSDCKRKKKIMACIQFHIKLHELDLALKGNKYTDHHHTYLPSKSSFGHRWWNPGHKYPCGLFCWCSHLLLPKQNTRYVISYERIHTGRLYLYYAKQRAISQNFKLTSQFIQDFYSQPLG